MLGERAQDPERRQPAVGPRHPCAIEVMREVGVDLTTHTAKSVTSIDPATVDLVVTLCTEEICPSSLSNVRRFKWAISDPTTTPELPHDQLLHQFRADARQHPAPARSARGERAPALTARLQRLRG